jgi:hypothetical protein
MFKRPLQKWSPTPMGRVTYWPRTDEHLKLLKEVYEGRPEAQNFETQIKDGRVLVTWYEDDEPDPVRNEQFKARRRVKKTRTTVKVDAQMEALSHSHVDIVDTYDNGLCEHIVDSSDTKSIRKLEQKMARKGFEQVEPWEIPAEGQYSVLWGAYSVRFRWCVT